VEIDVRLELADDQAHRVEFHSFVNIINIISGELQLIEKLLGADAKGIFARSLRDSELLVESFPRPEVARRRAQELGRYRQTVSEELERAKKRAGFQDPALSAELSGIFTLLGSVLRIADVRVKELLARHEAAGEWQRVPAASIRHELIDMLEVIAQHSRKRYTMVYDGASDDGHEAGNQYHVQIEVDGDTGGEAPGTLPIPPILLDSLRDLVANSRKYTPVGGRISAILRRDGNEVVLTVSDNGRGIPPDQLPGIVEFGIRGTNTSPTETQGGGFGLTKAYLVCKQFGGRMWIDSELGCGTTVTVRIPIPTDREIPWQK